MTTPIPPVTGYATVADYELRTGVDVPVDQEPTMQQRLNDTSALIDVYLGGCKDEVAALYPDVLTILTCSHVHQVMAVPAGIRSESVGGTSVSYNTEATMLSLLSDEMTLLDNLIDSACGGDGAKGIGQIGVNLGGEPDEPDDIYADADAWVLAGEFRKW